MNVQGQQLLTGCADIQRLLQGYADQLADHVVVVTEKQIRFARL